MHCRQVRPFVLGGGDGGSKVGGNGGFGKGGGGEGGSGEGSSGGGSGLWGAYLSALETNPVNFAHYHA